MLTMRQIRQLDIANLYKQWQYDQDIGYILEVTLRYPKHLHAAHNSYPVAAEHLVVDESILSDYARDCHRVLHGKETFSEKKLTLI